MSISAGIIPYTLINGRMYFLLGYERKSWSGFIGSSENDETPIDTAVREFNEETALIFNDYLDLIREKVCSAVPIVFLSPKGKKVHLYFIDFCESITQFKDNRKKLQSWVFHEKEKLGWFTMHQIHHSPTVFGPLRELIVSNFT